MKMQRTNVYDSKGNVIASIVDLPQGYFYKGKFYKSAGSLFKVLIEEGLAGSTCYMNGAWIYNDIWYTSLKELYEWNEDDFGVSYQEFVHCYLEYGVTNNPGSFTMYYCSDDGSRELFDSKEEAINNYQFELSDYRVLDSVEDFEEQYMSSLTDEELLDYSKKSIKQRIAILESWKGK